MKENRSTDKNYGNVYRHIYHAKTSSRQAAAADIGISLPTISLELKYLSEDGLIFNAGEFESTGGRKASMYSIVPDARLALGIDITQSYLTFVLVDMNLNQIDSLKLIYKYEDTDAYYQNLGEQIKLLLERNQVDEAKFLGVGISLPVIVGEGHTTITYASVIKVPEDLHSRLKKWIPYPFLLFNDANSAGWTEMWARESRKSLVYLSISNSVGGALIMNNRVYNGSNWRGAEFGHMTIVPHGERCYCGRRGCLDAYCSANVLSDFTGGDLDVFFTQLKSGNNNGYRRIFDTYLEHLAIAINNLRMCFDCDVVLGGNVGAYLEAYLGEVQARAARLTPFESNANYIKICSYRTEPSAVGAALYYIDKFIRTL